MNHNCLNDIQIQAVVDGEAGAAERAHVATCGACASRVARRQQQIAEIEQTLNAPIAMPAPLAERVQSTFASGASGATRLRAPNGGGRRRWVYSGFAVAAVTLIAVLFIVPAVRKHDATVSASEILAKSANQLAAAPGANVDSLVYELVLDGVPREMMLDHENGSGAYRVQEVVDHSVAGRYRLATYDPSGAGAVVGCPGSRDRTAGDDRPRGRSSVSLRDDVAGGADAVRPRNRASAHAGDGRVDASERQSDASGHRRAGRPRS